jgi:hypothetical protein
MVPSGDVLMLIDTRREPPPPPEPNQPPRWHFDGWRWLTPLCVGLVLLVSSSLFPPFPAYILIVGALVMIVRGLSRIVGSSQGLRDYHQ